MIHGEKSATCQPETIKFWFTKNLVMQLRMNDK